MIVSCVHPVPVTQVPRRARLERLTHIRRVTPVEVPEADASEFSPVPFVPSSGLDRGRVSPRETGCELYERGGRLWHPLVRQGLSDPLPRLGRAEFLRFLEGGVVEGGFLHRHFTRTPLLAIDAAYLGSGRDAPQQRGEDPATLAGARVLEDPGEILSGAVAAFIREEVALVGDAVFVRVAGPMAVQALDMEAPNFQMTLFPRTFARFGMACHVDDVEALREIQRRHGMPATQIVGRPGRLVEGEGADGIPRHLMGRDDIDLAAGALCGRIASSAWLCLRDPLTPERRGGMEALARRMGSLAALAGVGVRPSASVEAHLVELREAIDFMGETWPAARGLHAFAADYIDTFALPRLRPETPVPEEDMQAMASLGPGLAW